MRSLHVAAMPFPSVQGTQGAVRAMVDAEHEAGRGPELLTYAHGGFELVSPWPHHRIADLTRDRSLRSGPSVRKVVEDAQLAVAARGHVARMKPDWVISHHVEATAACLAARLSPVLFVAHTALEPELPSYLPPRASGLAVRIASRVGGALDVALARRADAVAAVSPWLASHLASRTEREVTALPIPWPVPARTAHEDREKARSRLMIDAAAPVILYAGNLDAYQGLDVLVKGFVEVRARRPETRLLIATESAHDELEQSLWSAGQADAVIFAPLADEPDRRLVHAAADVVWVPRHTPGGLPIKLLDAMARGVPTVASRAATADLDLAGRVMLTDDADPDAFAAATVLALEGRASARAVGEEGRRYIAEHHSPARFLEVLDGTVHTSSS
ncbi:MAG: glycosyltransferase [Sandaracinaceae bacterium]